MAAAKSKYSYNHKRDLPDSRDLKFHLTTPQFTAAVLPASVDLRKTTSNFPPILDQEDLGSCTANASSNALRYCLTKEKSSVFQPSRLFIYFYSRLLEGTVNQDSGASLRDVMRAINMYGACPEPTWPYVIPEFAVHPSTVAVKSAQTHTKNFQYLSVAQNLLSIKNALVKGFPIVFGIVVYDSFESDQALSTGNIPMPNVNTEQELGGHAILMTGYSDASQRFTFMNSWGTGVGQHGYFTIPYNYVLNPNLAFDFWVIQNFV